MLCTNMEVICNHMLKQQALCLAELGLQAVVACVSTCFSKCGAFVLSQPPALACAGLRRKRMISEPSACVQHRWSFPLMFFCCIFLLDLSHFHMFCAALILLHQQKDPCLSHDMSTTVHFQFCLGALVLSRPLRHTGFRWPQSCRYLAGGIATVRYNGLHLWRQSCLSFDVICFEGKNVFEIMRA